MQTHFLEGGDFGGGFPQASCGEAEPIDCFSPEYWRDLVLAGSDTAVAIISAIPVVGAADPLSIDAMERGKAMAAELCGDGRVLIQGHAVPDVGPLDTALAAMADVAAAHDLCAWKAYTHAPNGWYLDDHDPAAPQIGAAFLGAARDTGVPVIAVHKGLSGGNPFASPVDIGPAAAANPDLAFLVYHSGYEGGTTEGEYQPDGQGVDRLVRSVTESGIGAGGNVYAELGSTWRTVMGNPTEAAHVLGKLLVAFGPERILWGTDSHLVRIAAGPDRRLPRLRDHPAVPGAVRLPGADRRREAADPRRQRHRAVRHRSSGGTLRARRRRGLPGRPAGCQPHARPRVEADVLSTFLREHPWMAPKGSP